MSEFNYQWWTVEAKLHAGVVTLEIKAKSKEHAIRQIEREVKQSNSEKNLSKSYFERKQPIIEVYWDTLTLDRIGYQRLS